MFNDLRNKLIELLKVKEEVIEEEPEPIIKLGDVWKTKPDGWVGKIQEINEYVITSYNLEEDSIWIGLRKYCKYDLKNKIITCKYEGDPFVQLSEALMKGGVKSKLVTLASLTNNLIKTDDNFLEIDALLGE
ncbi:MAG: hypothetical protein GY829_02165 [Gammaproteobacteria bacterium]|nr:hypothetical protein [Gammaproteobacteria bacterium]